MLQQNNNNNYPCLTMSSTTREMLQKCSRAALPFPSRLELGDLPLIRGLRAWALCSKNRRKVSGLLGGGQSPAARPAGHRNSTSCTKPADVYLSGEWGQMGYGLPLGLDARQAEIGALVTVATLKTSEGSGKTQTQCLFLRTEKGSCLYSTAKPSSGVVTSAASSVVGGWLRGKTGGGGGRDTPAGRRDGGPTLSTQTGANRVRVRSGRRWRKSSSAAGREKAVVSRERQQRSREDPARKITLEERKEVQDKGALDSKLFPSLQRDGRRVQQEKEGACRTPKCSHNPCPKTCTQWGRGARRREEQEELEGGESQSNEMNGRKEKQKVDAEDKRSLSDLETSNFVLAQQNSDLESNSFHPESLSEAGEAESEEVQDSQGKDDRSEEGKGNRCEEVHVNRVSDCLEANRESETDSADAAEPSAVSNHCQDVSVSSFPESSEPVEGSSCWVQQQLENSHEEQHQAAEDPGIMGKNELHISSFEPHELNVVTDEKNTVKSNKTGKPEALCDDCQTSESVWRDELVSEDRINPEGGDEAGQNKLDDHKAGNKEEPHTEVDVVNAGAKVENHCEVERNCAPEDDWRPQESADGHRKQEKQDGDACGQRSIIQAQARGKSSTDVTNVACADPSSSPGLCLDNPAPSLPPLGSMATGRPRLVAEEEEEEDGVRVTARDGEGDQRGKRRHGSELEEQGKGERGSSGDDRKEEEEEEDEFGVFMQAEGEPACSQRFTMSASVPCGCRVSALGNRGVTGEPICWTSGWSDSSEDSWTAFPQDSVDGAGDTVGQWWPSSAVEERRLSANPSLVSVFAEAFPSLPGPSSSDPCDLDTVPTLTQLLRGRASQDHRLLDSFHDLNKMIGQRYKRAAGVSRDLLLKTLHLEQPRTESQPAPWTASRRLSPGLPSANQHAQNAAAKRRLSYDYNRNIMD
ncbi:hypothetical protein Q5P01_009609 [Channa striata]|uniref:Uncharacterized protein n=1 Tax=Channa striata TaxID=64152 RepID=A0AA88SSF0_CHASR|nr:hypothetical protein Q5P01_009609 [Channa striata]